MLFNKHFQTFSNLLHFLQLALTIIFSNHFTLVRVTVDPRDTGHHVGIHHEWNATLLANPSRHRQKLHTDRNQRSGLNSRPCTIPWTIKLKVLSDKHLSNTFLLPQNLKNMWQQNGVLIICSSGESRNLCSTLIQAMDFVIQLIDLDYYSNQ